MDYSSDSSVVSWREGTCKQRIPEAKLKLQRLKFKSGNTPFPNANNKLRKLFALDGLVEEQGASKRRRGKE